MKQIWAACAALMILGCGAEERSTAPPNILLIVADDMGVEQFAPAGIGQSPASTPNLDALAARGMQFSHVWAQPLCSPTRATLLTGRYGFRTGIGSAIGRMRYGSTPPAPEVPAGMPVEVLEDVQLARSMRAPYSVTPFGGGAYTEGLSSDEYALPALLKNAAPHPYRTAAIGKWHLASAATGWLEHPSLMGFDHYSVLMGNQPESYFSWWENINGSLTARTGYTPTQKVDDALQWIAEDTDQPWFLWLAFNLPHYPHHIPAGMAGDAADLPLSLDRMIERLDEAIGGLIDGIGDSEMQNTVIIFVGDNGTTAAAIDPPFQPEKAKFTIYEGGLRVPLIVAGPGIPAGQLSSDLVNTTDIFATALDIADVSLPDDRQYDSVSLTPYFLNPEQPSLRTYLYADQFQGSEGIANGGFAIRQGRWKLVKNQAVEELYDLESDPWEENDVLADGTSTDELAVLDNLYSMVQSLHQSEL